MKTKIHFLFALCILLLTLPLQLSAQTFSIIPKPVSVESRDGAFIINSSTVISTPDETPELNDLAELLAGSIHLILDHKAEILSGPILNNSIDLSLDPSLNNKEGYSLTISNTHINISGRSGAGLFYGIQSLLQLFPLEKTDLISIPCAIIVDYPRFEWRGVHLDVCRHFFPVEFVKKYIDILAAYKINTFHWHLTEDQGWRIEIKKYPKLTQISSIRNETMGDGEPHGGYFTQEQIKEVVEYAKQKYITVVPEIEMPGHALAALAAYPEFSCTGGPFEVGTIWGVYKDVYCAGNDNTFEFLENILTEVIDLFPSEYIHIGGDEVPKVRWEKCGLCQTRMRNENLKDEHELQSYFIQRIEKFLNSKGRKIIGWDEILEGGLAPNAAVMSWRGTQGGIDAAKMKHNVVMSPGTHCYFDHYQGLNGEPKAIGGYTPIEKIYSYEPVPDELSVEEAKYIMGAQANMWAEYYPTTDHVEYMLLPRLCALSEVVWSPKDSKNFDEFLSRMIIHYDILANKNYNFRIPPPINISSELLLSEKEKVFLESPIISSKIYYTLDGSEPNTNSNLYTDPLEFTSPVLLKTKTVLLNGKSSPTVSVQISFIDTSVNGLFYKYYEGDWDSIPKFWELRPVKKGKIHKLSLSAIEPREDYFGVDIFGFMKIERAGNYTFYLTSDDGSRLFINNKLIIDNDGQHSSKEISGKVFLEKGTYPFKIFYFEKSGVQEMKVEYAGPGINRTIVPANILFFDN
jgi:hexosaminidase